MPVLTRRRAKSPARPSAAQLRLTSHQEIKRLSGRPLYWSDGDSRPVLRGYFYEVVNGYLLRPILIAYLAMVAVFKHNGSLTLAGAACRHLHAAMFYFNALLSDELHNCDKRLGEEGYFRHDENNEVPGPLTPEDLSRGRSYPWVAWLCGTTNVFHVESALQLVDWLAAAGVPLTYHVVLYVGTLTPEQREPTDTALFCLGAAAYAALAVRCWPHSAARAVRAARVEPTPPPLTRQVRDAHASAARAASRVRADMRADQTALRSVCADVWRARRFEKTAATLAEDGAPSTSLGQLKAQAAPTHPRAPLQQLGSSPWPLEPASACSRDADAPPLAPPWCDLPRSPPPGVQMLLIAVAFGRYAALTAPKGLVAAGWPALWWVYVLGLLAKALERPRAQRVEGGRSDVASPAPPSLSALSVEGSGRSCARRGGGASGRRKRDERLTPWLLRAGAATTATGITRCCTASSSSATGSACCSTAATSRRRCPSRRPRCPRPRCSGRSATASPSSASPRPFEAVIGSRGRCTDASRSSQTELSLGA